MQVNIKVDTTILGVQSKTCPIYAKWEVTRSLQYLQKNIGMKLIFYLQINAKVFYKSTVSLWVCIARHAQSTQNKKFAMSLQYFKENVKNESFLQVEFNTLDMKVSYKVILLLLMGMNKLSQSTEQAFSKYSKEQVCNIGFFEFIEKFGP